MKKFKSFILVIFVLLLISSFSQAQSFNNCPSKTTPHNRAITFVGKAGLGGDEKVEVWFEYGLDEKNLNFKTKSLFLEKEGIFCIKVMRLKPCTTYYYRAGAKNKAGVNYGEIKNIKTLCKSNINNNPIDNLKEKIKNWVYF